MSTTCAAATPLHRRLVFVALLTYGSMHFLTKASVRTGLLGYRRVGQGWGGAAEQKGFSGRSTGCSAGQSAKQPRLPAGLLL